jgi:hypothetical protein
MAVPLANIAFLLQKQIAKKVTITSPCSKAQKNKTLTTYCNSQDMPLGHTLLVFFLGSFMKPSNPHHYQTNVGWVLKTKCPLGIKLVFNAHNHGC